VAILLLALALRSLGLKGQSLSSDEFTELSIAGDSPASIVVASDGFPPLYHLLLHSWLSAFPGDIAARVLSVIIGVLSVAIVWAAARRIGGERVAFWSALIVAVSPFHIWHSQESRAYILYYLFAALALYWFFVALQTNSRVAWACYAASAWAGLLTQYYFGLLILSNLCVLVLEWRRLTAARTAVVAHAALAVASIPTAWLLLGDFSLEGAVSFPNKADLAAGGYTLFTFLGGYALGPSTRELHGMSARWAITHFLPWLIVGAAAAGVLLVHGVRALSVGRWAQRLLVLTFLPVFGATAAAAALGITFQVRHVIWASIPLMILLGAGAAEMYRRRTVIGTALATLLLLFAISRYNRLTVGRYQNEDVRALAAYLRAQNTLDPVFVSTGYMARVVRHYLGSDPKVYSLPNIQPDGANLSQALHAVASNAPSSTPFWLVYTREFHGDPRHQILQGLQRNYPVTPEARFPGVTLYRVKVSPPMR
jgi:4-amino-4-deoxy-L-arabinose transferase-like glycosyltransferase